MVKNAPDLRRITEHRVRCSSGAIVLIGAWLLLAPFVLGYVYLGAPLANDLVVGAAILLLAVRRVTAPLRYEPASWINCALGTWLLFAPFLLGYGPPMTLREGVVAAHWNDMLCGVAVLVLASTSAVSVHRFTRGAVS